MAGTDRRSSDSGGVPRIVQTPDTLGGDPRIEGTRIGVAHVSQRYVEGDETPEGIAAGYDIPVAIDTAVGRRKHRRRVNTCTRRRWPRYRPSRRRSPARNRRPRSCRFAAATALNRVLLTADRSDFADPPRDDHAGIIIVASITRSGGEIRRGLHRLKTPATISPERSRLSATGCSAAVASVRLLLFSNTIVLNTETTQPEARAGLPIRLPATH